MKTNEQLETLIGNLIERMNRLEATLVASKPRPAPGIVPVQNAIAILEQATLELTARRAELLDGEAGGHG